MSNNFCFVLQYILLSAFGQFSRQPFLAFIVVVVLFAAAVHNIFEWPRMMRLGVWVAAACCCCCCCCWWGTDHVPLLVTALTVISVTQPAKGLLLCLTSSLSHFFALFSFNFAQGLLVCASLLGSYFTYFAQIVCVCCVCC